jgi:translation initiation factor 1
MSNKKRNGIVYSTDPNFHYKENAAEVESTLPPEQQALYVWLDSKGRSGKTVTLVKGFRGKASDLETLGQEVKKFCGTGGTVKEGEIVIQGNLRDKVMIFLANKGYKKAKMAGG